MITDIQITAFAGTFTLMADYLHLKHNTYCCTFIPDSFLHCCCWYVFSESVDGHMIHMTSGRKKAKGKKLQSQWNASLLKLKLPNIFTPVPPISAFTPLMRLLSPPQKY